MGLDIHGNPVPDNSPEDVTATAKRAPEPEMPVPAAQRRTEERGAAEAPKQTKPNLGRHSVVDVDLLLKRPMPRKTAGENVQKLVETFKAILADEREGMGDGYKLIVIDRNQHQVGLSSILVVGQVGKSAYVHTLLVETRDTRLGDREEQYGQQKVYVPYTAADVLDQKYWEKINLLLSPHGFGAIVDAGADFIHDGVEPTDREQLRQVLWAATNAIYTVALEDSGRTDGRFSVGMIGSSDTLKVRADFAPPPLTTATGLPKRSDVSITLTASIKSAGQIDEIKDLTRADGYVDLVYVEPEGDVEFGRRAPTQRYVPRFVLTEASSLTSSMSIEMKWLAFATAGLLAKNNSKAWANVFRPKYGKSKAINTRDIGALGYEVSVADDGTYGPVDTSSDAFTDKDLAHLLSVAVHGDLVYSMDVAEVGDDSWVNQAFIAAANGDEEATKYLIDGLNHLTLGHFGQLWDPKAALFLDEQVRTIHGWFTDDDGLDRPLADIDYLALLNLTADRGLDVVEAWSNAQDDQSLPMNMRLESQLNILRSILKENINIKGYGRLLTAHPDLMPCLMAALDKAGLVIRQDNMISDFSGATGRGNTRIRDYAVRNMQTGVFSYGNQSNYGNTRSHSTFGRWTSGRR